MKETQPYKISPSIKIKSYEAKDHHKPYSLPLQVWDMLCDLALSSMQQHVQTKPEKKIPRKTRGLAPHTPSPWGDDERTKNMWWMWDTSHNVMSSDTEMGKYPSFDRTERHLNFCDGFQWRVKMMGWVFWCHGVLAVNVHGSSNLVVSIDMFSSGHLMAFLPLLKSCVVLLCFFF